MAVGDLSFAFDASKETPDSVAKKRAIAEAIAARQMTGAPRDVGEGLNAIGQALLYRRMMGGVDKAEGAGRAGASSAMQSIIGALSGGNFPDAPRGDAPMSPMAGGEPMDPASARVAQAHSVGGDMSPFRDAIASIESDGHGGYAAIGPTHPKLGRALGRYQVMEANIGPWSTAALGREVTPDEFLSNPQIQDAIFDHRFGSYVEKYGNPQDAASAWFTGLPASQGAGRKDVLGTSGSQYVDKFSRALGNAGAAPASAGTPDIRQALVEAMANGGGKPPVQMAQAGMDRLPVMAGGTADAVDPNDGPSMAQLFNAAQNPWLSDTQRSLVNALLNREMQQNDPMRQMEMERAQLELEQLRNPQPKQTDDIREYEFARQQGYQGTFQDFMTDMRKAGATNVTVGGGEVGTIPQGFELFTNPETGSRSMRPIPGGPAAAEVDAKARAEEARRTGEVDRGGLVTQEIDRALDLMDTGILPDTGFGALLSGVPNTDAKAISKLLDTIRANIGFEELNRMRQQSPTGGALGQVTERELNFLQSVAGSLDQSQSADQLKFNLNRLWNTYMDTIHGEGRGPARRPLGGAPQADGAIPDGVDPTDWEFMTPEERALFR
ncbi:hypothetical protein GN330_22615 [Nitratireductor sp. CAU 1489]|uniref:Phage tail lysozyme domain-containing protein n=1 Tax=Nitratireductor arenosus TaxID=2682096 RepID=A0A844QLA4_9HYPH|nr:hypothetical protein [Nitratireductor arenosus]MVB00048.1 hypothetical protein [Nitratireductor arenosus]